MFKPEQLIAIRWTWWSSPEEYANKACGYIPPLTFLEWERDSTQESSCEVEYFGGEWWAGADSFGLVLDPAHNIRRVWASDVHTSVNRKGLLVADDMPHSSITAIGWEGAYKKFPRWRQYEKVWWAEGTFPAKPPVVAFAMLEDASEDCHKMWEAAKQVFGDLPVVVVKGHPNADGGYENTFHTFWPIWSKQHEDRLWSHGLTVTEGTMEFYGYMDDFGSLIVVRQSELYN